MTNTPSITARLARIQKALKAPKSQNNTFGKYKYRNCEDILEALKPLLQDDETVTINDDIVIYGNVQSRRITKAPMLNKEDMVIGQQESDTTYGDRFYVKATATFMTGGQAISSSAFAREPFDKKGMDASQITGATSSYARKYALNGLLLIDDTKDADATNNGKVDKVEKSDEIPDIFPAETAKNWKSIQMNICNEMETCKTMSELDALMERSNDDIQSMPDDFASFISDKYEGIKEGGFPEVPNLKFANVADATEWAKNRSEYLDADLEWPDLEQFEKANMPYLISRDGKPSVLDQSLNAKIYIKDGKTPSQRILEKFQFKIKALQSNQG